VNPLQDQSANLLTQLRDIQVPEPISWWPPAPGWWLLALVSIIALGYTVFALRRYRRQYAWRSIITSALDSSIDQYLASPSPKKQQEIMTLFKQGFASSKADRGLLAQTSDYWEGLLQEAPFELSKNDAEVLVNGHYQAQAQILDGATLRQLRNGLRKLKSGGTPA
jgi:hypothetical protein